MILPVNLPSGTLVVGQTLTPASGAASGTVPASSSFVTQFLGSLAQSEASANQAAVSYAQGGGASLAQVVTANAQADLASQEMSLLVGKALATYQSIMNMQV
jgi:flagellar hook-basal body complex protein FliE